MAGNAEMDGHFPSQCSFGSGTRRVHPTPAAPPDSEATREPRVAS
jgi:hypothetical protein